MEARWGLCIGGPTAGKMVKHMGDTYKVQIPTESPDRYEEVTVDMTKMVVDTFTYMHITGLRGNYEIDFLVPEGKDCRWVFDEVFNTYEKANAK